LLEEPSCDGEECHFKIKPLSDDDVSVSFEFATVEECETKPTSNISEKGDGLPLHVRQAGNGMDTFVAVRAYHANGERSPWAWFHTREHPSEAWCDDAEVES
jgi:hypothetical protein